MHERGEWRDHLAAAQLVSFEGLRWGRITPTDVDLLIDFGNRGFVLGEFKYEGRAWPLPVGQRLALQRTVDAWNRAGVAALGFVASHNADKGAAIVAAEATVVRIRWDGEWQQPKARTVAQLLDGFHAYLTTRRAA